MPICANLSHQLGIRNDSQRRFGQATQDHKLYSGQTESLAIPDTIALHQIYDKRMFLRLCDPTWWMLQLSVILSHLAFTLRGESHLLGLKELAVAYNSPTKKIDSPVHRLGREAAVIGSAVGGNR